MTWRDKQTAQRRAREDARRQELAEIRLQRPLTEDETIEEARLERALAQRVWREMQRETEARLKEAA